MKITEFKDLEKLAEKGKQRMREPENRIILGYATCGISAGARKIEEKVREVISGQDFDVELAKVGCIGLCHLEPLLDIQTEGMPRVTYGNLEPEKVPRIIEEHLGENEPVKEWAVAQLDNELSALDMNFPNFSRYEDIPSYGDLKFLEGQERIAMRNCGIIDPESLEEYAGRGGYKSAFKALNDLSEEEVIETILKSDLRGRGGAGFPTGKKWNFARNADGDPKYVICNADEGDPGAYMDRAILEGDPHSVLEGMIVGSYAMGASNAYIYVRAEYPLAIKRLEKAISDAYEYGLLGENIFGSSFSLDIEIKKGAGAFVCGEETALIHSIEGKRGEPRSRPPFPANEGLRGQPTNINNVETWANVPAIISEGSEWFSSVGTDNSGGTKVFSLVGKIDRTGLVEVPFGTKLSEVIYEIGGGTSPNKDFKAVQTGGPSGGCIPAEHLDVEIDYENLDELGSIIGSGGMVVMDEDDCAVDTASYFLNFTASESCGQCTPCRDGLRQMLTVLDKIKSGEASVKDIDLLEKLAKHVRDSSLCGLGGTAPNPVLSTLDYFRDEYLDHIVDKRCPAGLCRELVPAPCRSGCPAEVNVPVYVNHISNGEYEEGLSVHREKNPFPSICGRICPAFCEDKCRRGKFDDPVAIRNLKRFMAEQEENGWNPQRIEKEKPQSVGIVGGGPAGLTAALRLAQDGFDVSVYEAGEELGGMLVWGIPDYRLPKDVIRKEIESIVSMENVEANTNTLVGSDISLDSLEKMHDAVLIAGGASKGRTLGIPGENNENVFAGLDLLKKLNLENENNHDFQGKNVTIIGGGNVAIDSARSLIRMGVDEARIVYRRKREDMPAYEEEIEKAEEEDVDFSYLLTPKEIITENGEIKGLECQDMKLKNEENNPVFDLRGRKEPFPQEDAETFIETDAVIIAIGQEADLSFVENSAVEIESDSTGMLDVNPQTLQSAEEGIFAAGDIVLGTSSVIEAVAQGNRVSKTIKRYLEAEEEISPPKSPLDRPEDMVGEFEMADEDAERARQEQSYLSVDDRKDNFKEVQLGFLDEEDVKAEARRCMRCDLEPFE